MTTGSEYSVNALLQTNRRSILERPDADNSCAAVAQAPNSCWRVGEAEPKLNEKQITYGIFS